MNERLRIDAHPAPVADGLVVRHGDEETLEITGGTLEDHAGDLKKRGLFIPAVDEDWRWALLGAPVRKAVRLAGAPPEITAGFTELDILVEDGDAKVDVLVETGVDLPARRAFNERAWKLRRPWLLAQLAGPTILRWCVFAPGETACAECLETRLLANRRNPEGYRAVGAAHGGRLASVPSPALLRVAAGLLALEAARLAAGSAAASVGFLQVFDLAGMTLTREKLLPTPGCEVCGES